MHYWGAGGGAAGRWLLTFQASLVVATTTDVYMKHPVVRIRSRVELGGRTGAYQVVYHGLPERFNARNVLWPALLVSGTVRFLQQPTPKLYTKEDRCRKWQVTDLFLAPFT